MKLWALLAPMGFRNETERELEFKGLKPLRQEEEFFLFEGEPQNIAWSAVIWKDVRKLDVASISTAARTLKPLAKKWELLPTLQRRRSALVHEQLRAFKSPLVKFPERLELPEGTGAFTMLEEKEILWCRNFDRPDPLGRVLFEEDRESAPSRAYLKLWEAFSLFGIWPKEGEHTMDLGSSPGGWTWVLASLQAEVLSVDRSPLEPRVAQMKGVNFRKGDAFQVLPGKEDPVDWLCSDVICAPEKLLALVQAWIASGKAKHYACTLKFQGEADPAVVAEFQKLGRVLHLHHNKHELTFLR